MKKNELWLRLICKIWSSKIFKTMRLSIILLLIAVNCMWGNESYSQKTELSLELQNTEVRTVLDKIENESEFYFLYSNKLIDVDRKVDIAVKKQKINNILNQLFANTDVTYMVIDRQIVLSRKDYLAESLKSFQQQIEVTGTVTDAQTGDPLPGVNIVVQGTTQGTTTDMDGNYSIEAPPDATLVFSFVGYQEQTVELSGRQEINVAMEQAITELEEVVAVGYGTRERGMLTGSVSDIEGANIEQSSEMNVAKSLQGKMPGLVINDRGGEPGSESFDLLIRGKSTLGNNSPLIVVDGVPQGSFSNLSPNDIQSISVLKDASAAIYGARAANGVILVTTKRGSKNQETQIRFNARYGVHTWTRLPEMMNSYQYATYRNEVLQRYGMQPQWGDDEIEHFRKEDDPLNYPDTDWNDAVYNKWTPESQYNLSATGGSEDIQYYISGEYRNEQTMYKSEAFEYNQYQIRSNLDAQVTDYLEIGFNISGRLEDNHRPRAGEGLFSLTQTSEPFKVSYYPNDLPGIGGEHGRNPAILATEDAGWRDNLDRIFNSKLSFNLNMDWITDGMELSGYGAFDFNNGFNKVFNNTWTVYDYQNGNYVPQDGYDPANYLYVDQSTSSSKSSLYNVRLNYDRTFGDHNLSGFIAYEQLEGLSRYMSAYRRDLVSDKKVELFAGGEEYDQNYGSSNEWGRVNYFGSLRYNYQEKYLAEFTLRHDGSFNFAENNRFGTFPGISVGWRISEEPFMNSIGDWFSNLKLRASWSKMGNDQVPDYQYLDKYSLGGYYQLGLPTSARSGVYVSSIANPNITWENSYTQNAGFDAILWDGMLSVNFDYFFEKRRDILITRSESVPDYTALELPDENLGKVNNSGIEFSLGHNNKVGNVDYHINGNFTYNHNEIIFLDEPENVSEYRKQEGHPMDSWVVYKTDGIFNTQQEIDNTEATIPGTKPGDIKYVDINGDGEITGDDRYRKYTSRTPEIQYGLDLGMRYKGFEFNAFLQGQTKAEAPVAWGVWNDMFGNIFEYYYTKRWTEDNKESNFPRAIQEKGDIYNQKESDFWLKDASFIRLKNLEIAYNLPSEWLSGINGKGLRLYVRGSNLLTFSPIKRFDPEIANEAGRYYPQTTTITAGININL